MEEMFKKFSMTPEMLEQRNEAEAQLKFLAEKDHDYSTTRTEKKKMEEEQEEEDQQVDLKRPHLANLNQDPQLSRKVKYSIDKEETRVGKRGISPPNDIEIGGMGIRKVHAIIQKREGDFFLVAVEGGEDSGCYLNGNLVSVE
jgi:ATP-dependent 26S proteasome regulatory subunit